MKMKSKMKRQNEKTGFFPSRVIRQITCKQKTRTGNDAGPAVDPVLLRSGKEFSRHRAGSRCRC